MSKKKKTKLKLIDLDKAKNEIIRELAENPDLYNVCRHICYNNGFTNNSRVAQDMYQEVLMIFSKKDPEYIYNAYLEDPKKPFAICLGIAKKQFLTKPNGYNKHSFGTRITFLSNLKFDTQVGEGSATYNLQIEEEPDPEEVPEHNEEHIIYYLSSFLPKEDQEFIRFMLDTSITKGKYTQEFKAKKEEVFNKIREIAKEKNLIRFFQ